LVRKLRSVNYMHLTIGGNMKKIIAVVSALIIGGSVFVAAPAQASSSNDRMYAKILKTTAPELSVISNKKLIRSGKLTCRYLRAGATIFEAIEVIENAGLDEDTAMAMVAASVFFFCPEQEEYL